MTDRVAEYVLFGKKRENIVFNQLSECIIGLKLSLFDWSFYDWSLQEQCILFELKTIKLKKPRTDYLYALMNRTKLKKYKHIVFIYEYRDPVNHEIYELLYYIFDYDRIYEKRTVRHEYLNKDVDVIFIPMDELKPIDLNRKYEFKIVDGHITDEPIDGVVGCSPEDRIVFENITTNEYASMSCDSTKNTVLKWREGEFQYLTYYEYLDR